MMRLGNISTIASLKQLEDTKTKAESAAPTESGHQSPSVLPHLPDSTTLTLADAVGTALPLYQYSACVKLIDYSSSCPSPTSIEPEASVVPDVTRRNLEIWDLGLSSGPVGLKPSELQYVCHADDDTQSHHSLGSLAVPVVSGGLIKMIDESAWTAQTMSHPFLNDALSDPDFDMSLETDDRTYGSTPTGTSVMSFSRQASSDLAPSSTPVRTTLDTLLTALWEDCDARGLFRYDVGQCINRVVPGPWGWVAQLNEGRSNKKRATELQVDAVMQPFDARKFNFRKALAKEVLLQFEPLKEQDAAAQQHGWAANATGARVRESSSMTSDPTLIMINVSPIDYGHILLVPHVLAERPQQLTLDGLQVALAFVREMANPTFRLGYNSLGAYATINHLHFQGYYLPHCLPCEKAATRVIRGCEFNHVEVSELTDYPVLGWVLSAKPSQDWRIAEAAMAELLMRICGELQAQDQPYNVLIVDQGRRAFIWPQCYAQRQSMGLVPEDMLETGVNPAVFEVAGHLILKRAQDFNNATDSWAQRLLAGVSLSAARFAQLTERCLLS